MEDSFQQILDLLAEIKLFFRELWQYILRNLLLSFFKFETGKKFVAVVLYKQRGRMARRFMHTGMATLAAFGMAIAPVIAKEFPGRSVNPWEVSNAPAVLSATTDDPNLDTQVSDKVRDKIYEYTVKDGDTVSSIAEKFGISEDTIRWQNNLKSKDSIKKGQVLQILPVTGMLHKVQKGDTVYSIAKKYDSSAQAIVDFPYNTFTNDETFELAIGQTVVVPDGVVPEVTLWSPVARVKQITPDAGTVVASGSFVWPVSGTITQRYAWYHQGVDIANNAAPSVLAADAGTILVPPFMAGGYGNYVIVDHGNGTRTLYGHMSQIYVRSGQTVSRGSAIGKMGSTGRSTGIHLHFEVIVNGTHVNPLNVLK